MWNSQWYPLSLCGINNGNLYPYVQLTMVPFIPMWNSQRYPLFLCGINNGTLYPMWNSQWYPLSLCGINNGNLYPYVQLTMVPFIPMWN